VINSAFGDVRVSSIEAELRDRSDADHSSFARHVSSEIRVGKIALVYEASGRLCQSRRRPDNGAFRFTERA